MTIAGRSVILLGATGLIGGHCLSYLGKGDDYSRVITLSRRTLADSGLIPKIHEQIIDFNRLDQYRDLIRADHVICALGSTIRKAGTKDDFYRIDFTYPFEIARMAVSNGAEHFLMVSSMGADPASPFFYSRVKGELERAVLNLGFRSVSIFRPSLLLGKRMAFRAGEAFLKSISGLLAFALPARYRPIQAGDVARAILTVARENNPGVRIVESDEIMRIAGGAPT